MQFARTSGECFDWMIEPLTQEQRDAIVVTHWLGNKNFAESYVIEQQGEE